MSNNVLDKDAISAIAEMKSEFPHITKALDRLAREIGEVKGSVREIHVTCNEISTKQAVTGSQLAENRERIRCIEHDVDAIKEKVTILDTKDNIIGGANALFTLLATSIASVINQAFK